jgi:hypothetical protein
MPQPAAAPLAMTQSVTAPWRAIPKMSWALNHPPMPLIILYSNPRTGAKGERLSGDSC